jgi:hypothetical protein
MLRRPIILIASLCGLTSVTAAIAAIPRPSPLDPSIAPVVQAFWVVRQAAIVVGIYLVVTMLLGALTRVCRLATLTAALDRITVRPVRQLVVVATALAITGTGVAGAATTTNEPPPVLVHLPHDSPTPPVQPPPVLHRLDQTPPPAPASVPTRQERSTATVTPGGNLWTVAESSLRSAWGRQPRASEVAPYWRTLIELNRGRLAHPDDPDLVYAGQTFTLPPTPPAR